MKSIFWAVLICLLSPTLSAQTAYSVKGSVADTAALAALVNTSVSILNAKDSTLVKFTRADAGGSFAFNNLRAGKYILLLTYPQYADFVESFSLDSSKTSADFGKINMVLKSKLLSEVIVKGKAAAIKIKGDTTEFNAGSYNITANSKVEDLLKQLPGIQVDKDGKITAHGETVKKVLVDGEEFFGDDPTLVTKNLRGDMVDKVQLYDKKSDQAAFTGIDDGEKTKTLNLKLKEDKKNGYFGKIDAGGGNDEFYQNQGMFNSFKGKEKIAAYGILSNTRTISLGWEDSRKYGAATDNQDDGGMMNNNQDDNNEVNYNGEGIPTASNGGAHYENKWNNDKESINANYKIAGLSIGGQKNNWSRNLVPMMNNGVIMKDRNGNDSTTVFRSRNDQQFNNYGFRQKLDVTYQLKIDTTSNLKLVAEGMLRNTRTSRINFVTNTRDNDILQNNNNLSDNNDGKQQSFFASAFYNKKLKKVGRTYSVALSQSVRNVDDEGYLNSRANYYDEQGNLINPDPALIDQLKTNQSLSSVFSSNLTYTEPITKAFSVVMNYGFSLSNSTSDRRSFNKDILGNYGNLDTDFSNNFELNQASNQVGAIFNYKKGKALANIGSKVATVQFNQIDVDRGKRYERDFINLKPQASYEYRFSQFKSAGINYKGNTAQPTLNQIQPILMNNDPLNIVQGNPDLKPKFDNHLHANFRSFKVLTSQFFGIFTNYSFTFNPIVPSISRDAAGVNRYRFQNLADKTTSNLFVNTHFSRKIDKLGFNVGLWVNVSNNTNYSYINDVLNKQRSSYIGSGFIMHKFVEKKFYFNSSIGPRYYWFSNTLRTALSNNGGGLAAHGGLTRFLPKKFEISTDFNYDYTAKTQLYNESVGFFVWNASFAKKFLKDESLKLSVSGRDLLDQNRGFSRMATDNSLLQNSHTTIRRYFLLSLQWDFNKMGGGLKPKN